MIVSRIKPHAPQEELWPELTDKRFFSVAQTRTYCGDFYEEAARVLFKAERHQIDGRADICPDLSIGGTHFLEVKSLAYGCAGMVYAERLRRDRKLVREHGKLTYVFFVHKAPLDYKGRIVDAKTLGKLRATLAASLHSVIAIPFKDLMPALSKLGPKTMNYRASGKPMPGYRIPWATLRDLSSGQSRALWGSEAYGHRVPPCPLFGRL